MPLIVHYKNRAGFAGKLKGELTLTDGRTLSVWDDDLHQQCLELARERVTPITYEFKTSAKWGDTLTAISRTQSYEDAYNDARAKDEERGRVKPNSYLGRKIAKGAA